MKKIIIYALIAINLNLAAFNKNLLSKFKKYNHFNKFSELPYEMRINILEQRLISLIKEVLDFKSADDYSSFFHELGHLALVNKEFLSFVRLYIPIKDPNKFPLYSGPSLLAIAIENKWENLWKFIIYSAISKDIELSQEEKDTALSWFALNNNEMMVNMIANMGANKANIVEFDLYEINRRLILDVTSQNLEAVKYLLSNGAHPNSRNLKGETPVIHAVSKHDDENIVKLLLNYGANINARNNIGNTALIIAAIKGYDNITKLLLTHHNIYINTKNNHGNTALMNAVIMLKEKIVLQLLQSGANPNLKDNEGLTAYEHALSVKNKKICKILKYWRQKT